jgi:hypothetical protein
LLEYFDATVGREHTFEQTTGNDILRENSNENVTAGNFVMSENPSGAQYHHTAELKKQA